MNVSRLTRVFVRIATRQQNPTKSWNRLICSSAVRMEEVKQNPFYSKYADKIKKLQEEKPEEFESKINSVAAAHKKELEQKNQDREEAAKAQESSQVKPKVLEDFMKVELIQDKTYEEIQEIWVEYHKEKDFIYAVIPKEEYEEMMGKSREFGTFIYPVPRGDGYEFFLQQFSNNMINFTPLIMYQTHKENAPPCLTITHYEDIKDTKGIVLMHGEPDTKILSIYEAQLLAMQVKMYYGLQSGLKFNLVRLMNTSPASFSHMDLIKEFDNWKKDVALSKENIDSKFPIQKRQ